MIGPLGALGHQLLAGDMLLGVALGLGCGWLVCGLLVLLRAPNKGWERRTARFAWQFATLLGLEQAYEFTRGRMVDLQNNDVALLNAYRLLDWEWRHGFFVEGRIERFFLQSQLAMSAVDVFYVVSHVAVTLGVMVWLYSRRREHFPFLKNMLMVTTAIALAVFYLYPTAPPRMLSNYGFVDPAVVVHHLIGDGGAQPGSYTYNPYAAMPSLHVGYALIVGWSLFRATRRLAVRVIALLYPLAMGAAVIISGNHWLLDVAGAVVTVLVARLIVLGLWWLQLLLHGVLRRGAVFGRSLHTSMAE